MTLENDAAQPIKWKVIFTKIFEGINFYECLHATKPSGFVDIFFFFFFLQTKEKSLGQNIFLMKIEFSN